jgi:molybdopterin synthase catalytic subunit
MPYFTRQPIQTDDAERDVADPSAGAIVTFIGTTRNTHAGKQVLRLEYEAHEAIAEKMIARMCDEACKKFGLTRVFLLHRLGVVEIGEVSIVIGVSSAHRAAAFDGCRHLIDTLKTTIPIFKKEYYADQSAPVWVGPDGKPVTL